MWCWVVTVVGHVLTGPELQDFHKAKRNAPLKKKLLVEGGIAAAVPAALRTSAQSRYEELAKTLTVTLSMLNVQEDNPVYIVQLDRIGGNNLRSHDRSKNDLK